MAKDLRGTPTERKILDILGPLENPETKMFTQIFARFKTEDGKVGPALATVDSLINIGPQESKFVKPDTTTTVGIYIFNKFLLEPLEVFGYVNKPVTQKVWENLETELGSAMMAGDVSRDQGAEFIDRSQYLLGGSLSHIINPSISSTIINLPKEAKTLFNEEMKTNAEGISNNDPLVSSTIERKVVTKALEVMRQSDDPALGMFESGAIDPYNNYRTMFVMKGAIKDNTGEYQTGYKIVKSNYNDGLAPTDVPIIADALVTSSYSTGVATQDSGTLGKKYNGVFQRIKALPKGSDCKSTTYMKVKITKRHIYRYIVENGKLVLLDNDNIDKYIGKVCDMRSPCHCHAKDPAYCNICLGERPYKTENYNIGLTFSTISGSTLNASMKVKHDVTVKYYKVTMDDVMKYVH